MIWQVGTNAYQGLIELPKLMSAEEACTYIMEQNESTYRGSIFATVDDNFFLSGSLINARAVQTFTATVTLENYTDVALEKIYDNADL